MDIHRLNRQRYKNREYAGKLSGQYVCKGSQVREDRPFVPLASLDVEN